jgi:2-polyprenyl-3-methyl-5-hydroxy-6-metoxy-1,4-benzoquinol methylase
MKTILRKLVSVLFYILPARFALRLLLRLDNWIYYLLGKEATHANHGVHPKHHYLGYHEFFIQHIHSQDRVLAIGCGNGVVALEVAEKTGAKIVNASQLAIDQIEMHWGEIWSKLHPIESEPLCT